MIKLVEKFDFLAEINEEIKLMLIALHGNLISDEELSRVKCSPSIVGQEADGIIIYTWCCNLTSIANTYLAIFDQVTRKSRLIFTQEKSIKIVNASVNSDRTLVAFSIVEKMDSAGYVSPDDSGDNYKSYIAEISPQNRVFSLNIEWKTYQKVQFLRENSGRYHKISHMLFFHHKESIGLYHIPIFELDNRFMMSMQPSTQRISDQFIWSQFDTTLQRLYFVKLVPLDEEAIDATALLSVVEFSGNGEFKHLLNFPLPMTFKMSLMQEKAVYYDHYLSSTVSSSNFNMAALTTNSGSFYICYQNPLTDKMSADSQSDISESSYDSTTSTIGSSISYTICCIHGGYKVQCSTSYKSDELNSGTQLLFTLFNDYLVVFLASSFLHLLDINCEHEPVHNMLLDHDSGLLPVIGGLTGMQVPLFSTIITNSFPSKHNLLVFENENYKGYKFELCRKGFFKYFLCAKAATRIAILHASMNHFNDKKFTKKIIERACQDSANMETLEIFKEYMILAAYMQIKRMVVSPLDLKIFPFTTLEFYRGQVERNEDGERVFYLSYKDFPEDIVRHFQKMLRKSKSPFWSNVLSFLCYEFENRNKRFPLKLLRYAAANAESLSDSKKNSSRGSKSTESDLKAASLSSLTDLSMDQIEAREIEFRNSLCTEKIVSYITKIFGKETKSKATNMCREYTMCRNRIIVSFWRSVMKSLNFTNDDDIMSSKLDEPASELEVALFQLIERLKCIVDQLSYPGFPSMKQLLCTLGFRALSRYQFFQYVDGYILELDINFVRRALLELGNDSENVALKLKMVSYLPKSTAHALLKEWNHKYGNRYLAKQIMAKLPSEHIHYNSVVCEPDESSQDFVPLRTLLESAKMLGKKTVFFRPYNDIYETDIDFVGNVALVDTESITIPNS